MFVQHSFVYLCGFMFVLVFQSQFGRKQKKGAKNGRKRAFFLNADFLRQKAEAAALGIRKPQLISFFSTEKKRQLAERLLGPLGYKKDFKKHPWAFSFTLGDLGGVENTRRGRILQSRLGFSAILCTILVSFLSFSLISLFMISLQCQARFTIDWGLV